MSIWSRIGLADRDTLRVLQRTIEELREENTRLLQEQTNGLTGCMESNAKEIKDGVCLIDRNIVSLEEKNHKETEMIKQLLESCSCKIDNGNEKHFKLYDEIQESVKHLFDETQRIEEKASELSLKVEKEKELVTRNYDQIISLLKLIQFVVDEQKKSSEVFKQLYEIDKILERIEQEITANKKTVELNQNELYSILEKILSVKQSIDDLTLRTEKENEELSAMGKYLSSLWESMKLVWINDILDGDSRRINKS